ncbi:MAG TPA: UPF0280 family protein [Methylomirabilota bacterium]|nr:UPF0280 family protein [Methylomirabilota bacterium]
MTGATIQLLTGDRLHLSEGPIDVVLKAWGEPAALAAAYRAAAVRFGSILGELCAELPELRRPVDDTVRSPMGRLSPVGARMRRACLPFAGTFVTPMAAVAGAVADELMAAMSSAAPLTRAYVNDGGDIAVYCGAGEALDVAIAGAFGDGPAPVLNGAIRVEAGDGIGGVATSGARGRSLSLGIADSVTVLAASAADADVAATLIANAVVVDHPAIRRSPAVALDPDSDLGDRLVTVDVGILDAASVRKALDAGRVRALEYVDRGLIRAAALTLQGLTVTVGRPPASRPGTPARTLFEERKAS